MGVRQTCAVAVSAQYDLITGLSEMLILRQRSVDAGCVHDEKTGAICQAPALVRPLAIEPQCLRKLLTGLRGYRYPGVLAQGSDDIGGRGAKMRSGAAERIQELYENHFACDNSVGGVLPGSEYGLRM